MRWLVNARNRSIAVDGDRFAELHGRFDLEIDAPGADVRPGLINAHDHLHRNHYGRLGEPPYRNAYEWARHIHFRCRRQIEKGRAVPRREALLAGAWKNLFAGVTTVVHHDRWEEDFDRDFPIRVARIESADSLGMADGVARFSSSAPYCLHVAEGVDDVAAAELDALDSLGLLTSRLIAVHGVGIGADAVERFRAAGAALVWCPSSNLFLFGTTASDALLASGADILIGSDSLLTGEGDLLEEIRIARARGVLSDRRLEDAVGCTAARRFELPEPSLEAGAAADFILVDKPLLESRSADVALVVVDGIPRVARPDLVRQVEPLAGAGTEMKVGSVTRWANTGTPPAAEGRRA